MKNRTFAFLLLFIVTIIWAIAAVVVKYTLGGIEPLPFLTYRFLISFVIAAFALAFTRNKFNYSLKTWAGITIYSFLTTTFSLGLLFLGLDQTTVLELAIIGLAGPLLAEYAGVIFLKEHLTKREKLGTLIAFLGTIFTIVEPVLHATDSFSSFTGNILLLISTVGDIAALILLKKLIKEKIQPFFLTNMAFIIGFITLLPVTIIAIGIPNFVNIVSNLSVPNHLGVIYMAVFSGTIAYTLRARAQKSLEVSETAIFGYLSPIISVPLAVIFLSETITPIFIIGGILVAIGIFIAETKSKSH
jgi:drug/metabolite transporter (DMT)-like permease